MRSLNHDRLGRNGYNQNIQLECVHLANQKNVKVYISHSGNKLIKQDLSGWINSNDQGK